MMSHSSPTIDTSTQKIRSIKDKRDDQVIEEAIKLLETRLFATGPKLKHPDDVRNYLHMTLMQEPNEVFSAVFLDSQHQVIACEALFRGTIDSASVYPRVIVQRALMHNAAALILAHQHPSGETKPSVADQLLTSRMHSAMALVDIKLLDHFIIGKGEPFSFAEAGLL